jgi:glutaredoxin
MNIRRIALSAGTMIGLLIAASAAAQYRWVDPSGSVSYGDQPPGNAKNVTKMDPRSGTSEDASSALPFELRRAMAQHPVTLYTALDCGPCDTARVYLRRRGVPFSEIVVDTDKEAAELKRRVGTDQVPVMTLGRTPSIGFNERTWSAALDAARYPAQSQLPVTYRQPPPQPLLPEQAAPRAPDAPATNQQR